MNPKTDAEIIAWLRKVRRYDSNDTVTRKLAARDVKGALPKVIDKDERDTHPDAHGVAARRPERRARRSTCRASDGRRPAPLRGGRHPAHAGLPRAGDRIADSSATRCSTSATAAAARCTCAPPRWPPTWRCTSSWAARTRWPGSPRSTRARWSRTPRCACPDCDGKEVASGTTDARGLVQFPRPLARARRAATATATTYDDGGSAWFVSARATDDAGVEDLAFTWSDWQRGIEPWRFNVPTSLDPQPDQVAHTVFDRTLLRAGETVSMKHLLRTQTSKGFGLPEASPDTLVVTHVGSGQQFTQALRWRKTGTGGRSAESTFAIPPAAKLGVYQVELRSGKDGDQRSYNTGSFRVEEFRLPVLEGRIAPGDKKPLVAVDLAADRRADQLRGRWRRGPIAGARVGAWCAASGSRFADFDAFSFSPPQQATARARPARRVRRADARHAWWPTSCRSRSTATARGQLTIDKHPGDARPRRANCCSKPATPTPTARCRPCAAPSTLWPAAVIAGIKTEGWVSTSQKLRFQALALDLAGKPRAGVTLNVRAIARITTTSRKRMVGGFYTYDNKTDVKEIGTVCTGKSDARGLLLCEVDAEGAGAGRTDRQRHRQGRPRQPRRQLGLRHAPGRALVRRRGPRPHRRAAREEELPARRSRQVPGAQPLPLRDRAGVGGTRRRDRDARRAAQRTGPDREPAVVKPELGSERLRERARAARSPARGAVVQLLHLGLQGAARVVDGLLVRGQGVRRAHRAGRPQQAGLPPRPGRDPRRHAVAPHRREGRERPAQLPGARHRRRSPSPAGCPTASPRRAPRWRWPRSTRPCWS